jgi:hypothetical protein
MQHLEAEHDDGAKVEEQVQLSSAGAHARKRSVSV